MPFLVDIDNDGKELMWSVATEGGNKNLIYWAPTKSPQDYLDGLKMETQALPASMVSMQMDVCIPRSNRMEKMHLNFSGGSKKQEKQKSLVFFQAPRF